MSESEGHLIGYGQCQPQSFILSVFYRFRLHAQRVKYCHNGCSHFPGGKEEVARAFTVAGTKACDGVESIPESLGDGALGLLFGLAYGIYYARSVCF